MHALVAFAIGPVGRYVVLAGLLTSLVGGVYIKVTTDAADAERARIERQERKNEQAAKRELDRLNSGDRGGVSGFDRD